MSELLTRRQRAESALIIDSRPRRPVYHAQGVGEHSDILNRFVWWTRCGRSVGWFSAWLPRRLATKIARPCRQCYGDLPEQLELPAGVTSYTALALLRENGRA